MDLILHDSKGGAETRDASTNPHLTDAQPLGRCETGFPFLSLPPEIRMQILRYLVLGEGKVHPQYPKGQWTTQYHMRILETCSQLYEEASAIFYAENIIEYEYLMHRDGTWVPIESFLSENNLARFRNVQVAFYSWQSPFTPKALISMLRYLLRIGCSLRTLNLRFFISSREDPNTGSRLATRRWHRATAAVFNRLRALKVQQIVEVFVSSRNRHDGEDFDEFMKPLTWVRGWRKELQKYEVHKIPLKRPRRAKKCGTLYEWTWLLLPAKKHESTKALNSKLQDR